MPNHYYKKTETKNCNICSLPFPFQLCMLIWRESQLFSHYTPPFCVEGKMKMKIGALKNSFFFQSSICVGYLTHRLVHFRIRVNGPEDNGCMCLPKTQSVGYASAMIIGSKSSIVTTSCICSWVVVVNWFTTFRLENQ